MNIKAFHFLKVTILNAQKLQTKLTEFVQTLKKKKKGKQSNFVVCKILEFTGVTHSLCLFQSLFLTVFHSIRIQEFVIPHIRVQRYKMCDYHHAWPRECVWVCVWSWPVVLHAAAKIQKTTTQKHSDTHTEPERRRNLLLKIAETPLNTSLCWPCRCSECVCVRHVPAHVSGRLWGCVGGWMERSGRALASSCYHIRSHPNLSARPEREREREISLWSWTFTDCRAVTKISCHPLRLRKRHYR